MSANVPLLSIRLLGGFALQDAQGVLRLSGSGRVQSLIAYLLLHRQRPLARDQIAFAFWPDSTESNARTNLRALLYRLRGDLPDAGSFLYVDGETVQWRNDLPFHLDVAAFEQALAAAHNAAELQGALDLYTGDLLPDFYDGWVEAERERLREHYIAGAERLVTFYEQQGAQDAVVVAQRLLQADPLREESVRRLLRLHAQKGDRTGLERVWQAYVEMAERELDLAPSAALVQAYEQWRGAVQPLMSARSLPTPPTPFVGREPELADLSARLVDPACRLLTLVGPGGMGKTRLALRLAEVKALDFVHHAVFVPLVGLAAADYLATAIAEAAAIPFHGNQPPDHQLLRRLRDRQMLLVLDNYEHLLPNTRLVERILAEAPGVKLLVTSRERLNLQWEWRYPLQGLPVPQAGAGSAHDNSAVQLFVQTARRVQPGFAAEPVLPEIIAICQLVAGMPLGIELAASWVQVLDCHQILAQLRHGLDLLSTSLRDVPERQRNLLAIFDQSWQMLSAPDQQVFAQLSVFRGGFTLDAAMQVAGASIPTLAMLMDKSLLRRGEDGRYEIHELLRQYSAAKLAAQPEQMAATFNRHCAYYAAFMEQHKSRVSSPPTLRAIDRELDNIRAAWQRAVETVNAPLLEQFADVLRLFYVLRALHQEAYNSFRGAVAALQQAVEASESASPLQRRVLGRLLTAQGMYSHIFEGWESVHQLNLQAIAYLQPLGPSDALAAALMFRGRAEGMLGQYERSVAHVQESLAMAEAVDDPFTRIWSLIYLGQTHEFWGLWNRAEQYLQEARVLSQSVEFNQSVIFSSILLARLVSRRGQYEQAHAYLQDACTLAEQIGDQNQIALTQGTWGMILYAKGEYAEARRFLLRAYEKEALREQPVNQITILGYLGRTEWALGDVQSARSRFEQTLRLITAHRFWVRTTFVVNGMAPLYMAQEPERALAFLSLVMNNRHSGQEDKEIARQHFQTLAAGLPTSVVQAAETRGRELTLEQVAAELLRELAQTPPSPHFPDGAANPPQISG